MCLCNKVPPEQATFLHIGVMPRYAGCDATLGDLVLRHCFQQSEIYSGDPIFNFLLIIGRRIYAACQGYYPG